MLKYYSLGEDWENSTSVSAASRDLGNAWANVPGEVTSTRTCEFILSPFI